jgi:Family of unknown function (DUF6152)
MRLRTKEIAIRMPKVFALIAMLAVLTPAAAHHTYVTKYDSAKKVTVSGTISNVRYQNPHIFFDLNAGGTTWTIETESLSVAKSSGLTEQVLIDGAKATLSGWPARDGAAELGLNTIQIGGKSLTLRRTAR